MVFHSQPNAHYELLNQDPNTPTAATKPNAPFVVFKTTKRTLGAGCGGKEDVVVRVAVVEVVDCGDGAKKWWCCDDDGDGVMFGWSYGGEVAMWVGHSGDSGVVGMTKQDGGDVVGIRPESRRRRRKI
ncbi:hypothetical protein Tco_0616110 [Tanacetum coccineum]